MLALALWIPASVSAHGTRGDAPPPVVVPDRVVMPGGDSGLFRGSAGTADLARVQDRTTDALPAQVARRRVVQTDGVYLQTRLVPRMAAPDAADLPKRIAGGGDAVRLNLFADTVVDATMEKFQHTLSGDLVWQGRLGGRSGAAHLVIAKGRVTGSVTVDGIMYSILPDKDGNTVIDQIDPSGFPPVGAHFAPELQPSGKEISRPSWMKPLGGPSIVGDPNTMTTITLAVAYTAAAAAQATDIVSEINLAVAQANAAYANSGANITLQLAGTFQTGYSEGSKNASTVISEARSGLAGSGSAADLYSARRAYGADIVALIVKDYSAFQACGVAYMLLNPTASAGSYAVSASMRGSCIVSNQTLAHEIGHNMGLAHDRYAVSKYNEGPWYRNLPQDYDYFGYADTGARELTVMSYFDACRDVGVSCTRATRFSSPDRNFGNGSPSGVALGQTNPANNTRVLNANKDVVATWRPSTSTDPVLTVVKSGTGGGTVISSPAGISCGSDCLSAYASGTSVTLSASAASTSSFAGWSGACSGTAATASVTVTASTSCTATFTLNAVVAPANDAFASATAITGTSGSATGSTVGASKETGEPNHAGNRGGHSAWWTWTPASSGSTTITTAGSSFDTLLAIYTGSSVGALTGIASNDDVGRSRQSSVTFNVTGGTTYAVAVDGYNGDFGSVTLNWTHTTGSAPANDAFAGAVDLTSVSGVVSGSNRFATKEAGEPSHAGNAGGASVWWKITPNRNARVRLSTSGSNFDTTLAVYTGTAVNALTRVAANDDAGNTLQSSVSFRATSGTTYYIAVDGHGGATGSIRLGYSGGPSASHQVENGWWWSPAQPGSGIAIEQSGGSLYVGAYLYDTSGKAVWYAAMGSMTGTTFNGALVEYAGGQTLRGLYRKPEVRRIVGDIRIDFSSETAGTVTWPGGTMAIQRYDIVSGGAYEGSADGDPEAGWWWNEFESGRGYFIESQGSGRTAYVGGYMYDSDGAPVWYIAIGGLQAGALNTGLTLTGELSEYANGQSLGGAWQSPRVAGPRGTVTIQFTSATTATLTLPDGRQVTLTRFAF